MLYAVDGEFLILARSRMLVVASERMFLKRYASIVPVWSMCIRPNILTQIKDLSAKGGDVSVVKPGFSSNGHSESTKCSKRTGASVLWRYHRSGEEMSCLNK